MRTIIDQMIHDISGKATVLSIMNEIHSNKITQQTIDQFIGFILQKRTQFANMENLEMQSFQKNINQGNSQNLVNKIQSTDFVIFDMAIDFLNNTTSQTVDIINITHDEDVLSTIQSLVFMCNGYKNLIKNTCNKDNIHQLANQKSIVYRCETIDLDIVTGFVLIIKDMCNFTFDNNQLTISGLSYDFFKQKNGIINFLKKKYDIKNEFSLKNKTNTITWSVL